MGIPLCPTLITDRMAEITMPADSMASDCRSPSVPGESMRQIVLQVFALSLDGVIETEGSAFEDYFNSLDDDPGNERWVTDSIDGASLHAVGRATYESMSKYFPTASHDDGANTLTTSAIDDAMNRIPKAVFSKTLTEAAWGPVTILRGDTLEELARLREEGDGYVLVHGGATFAQALVRLDAIDEFRLAVYPFVAGTGPKLFTEGLDPRVLDVVAVENWAFGGLGLTLRRPRW
jgi:dihydrofolate reductase